MLLELDKTYETRDGGVVKITNLDYSYTMPYFGIIRDKQGVVVRPCSYNGSGMVNNHKQSNFDIVKEII